MTHASNAGQSPIALAIKGDQAAMSRLLLSHHAAILAAIRKVVGERLGGRVSPEDVAQLVYIDAFRGVGKLTDHGEEAFRGWLLRIAANRAMDEVRRECAKKRGGRNGSPGGRATAGTESLEETLLDRVSGRDRTPSQAAARQEALETMRAAIKSLLPDQQRVLELRYLQGLSAGETATQLGKTPRAVHAMCQRALERLRELMGSASQFLSS
ncbi:MAG: sigma-70 family RNA polymerase sigma factor [Planctomycetota bacterium]|nr:sigma-70 family RNA polymerase sigma factor [Planctomycetota bacterium]